MNGLICSRNITNEQQLKFNDIFLNFLEILDEL